MFIELPEADIFTEIYGSGKPLIMIHGSWCDHRLMAGCMENIFGKHSSGWKRIYFDLPGMGRTKIKKEISSSDSILEVIENFIEKTAGKEKFFIAAESYGAYLAQAAAEKYKDQLGGIMMLCPVTVPLHKERELPEMKISFREREFYENLSDIDKGTCDNIFTIQTKENWQRYIREVKSGLRISDITLLKKIKKESYPLKKRRPDPDFRFTKPALIITGRQDLSVGYKDQLALLDKYPSADFVILERAGHMLQIEQKEIFELLVKRWLERL